MPVNSPDFKTLLSQAREEGYAVGAFNIFDSLSARAVIAAANETETPVILQTSSGTVKQFGAEALCGMLRLVCKDARVPALIHLDHCSDPALVRTCIDSGWDSVMVDMSERPLEENISITRELTQYARSKGVCVEGELGIIKGVEEDLSYEAEQLAGYDDSIRFLEGSGVDAFAPAIGTAHGLYKSAVNINYDLVKRLADAVDTPLVVHGGTGLSDEQFARLIKNGASKINVSTALKYAYIDSLKNYWETHKEEYNPIKLNNAAEASVKQVVREHILRFKPV